MVDHGFELQPGQTKNYKIVIFCFSAKHAALRTKSKDWLARNQGNVSKWSDMLTIDGCFSELALYKNTTKHVGLVQSRHHCHLIEYNLFSSWHSWTRNVCITKYAHLYKLSNSKNYIYSNGDLDLWPNDPKIYRVLPLPQGNHVVKFGKDPIYRTKVMWKRPLSKILFIVMVTLTFDPKINRVLPLPQGNHVAKFGKDPIYRTSYCVETCVDARPTYAIT